MRRRIRLLPAVIFVAALTLTLKLGSIWQGLQIEGGSPAAAASESEAQKPTAKKKNERPTKAAGGKGRAKTTATKPKSRTASFDPSTATEAELDILEKLAARRAELEQRGRDLELRESLLRAAESRIDGKIGELKQIKATIEALLKRHDAQEEAKMKSLVKIYESMKPKDAARIFEKLELAVLLDVVERMREARTAPILAKMDPTRAKEVTAALAARRTLPKVNENAPKTAKK